MLATQEGCTAQHSTSGINSCPQGQEASAWRSLAREQAHGGGSQSIGVGRGGVFTTERVNSSVSFLKCSNNFSVQKKKYKTPIRNVAQMSLWGRGMLGRGGHAQSREWQVGGQKPQGEEWDRDADTASRGIRGIATCHRRPAPTPTCAT